MVLSIVVAVIGLIVGVFGWAQIIGSIQHASERGAGKTLATIIIWAVILGAVAFLFMNVVLTGHVKALLIGYAISLILVLAQGKVE